MWFKSRQLFRANLEPCRVQPANSTRQLRCALCGDSKGIGCFSSHELVRGAGASRCKKCDSGFVADRSPPCHNAHGHRQPPGVKPDVSVLMRLCSSCGANTPMYDFSPREWLRGPGVSICQACTQHHACRF